MGFNERLEALLVVLAWFALNIAMGTSTKWLYMYGQVCIPARGCEPYKFPFMITVIHMLFSYTVCFVHIRFVRRPDREKMLNCRVQFRTVGPLACCFALSVAMGNLSLKYVYPSFNQMLGSMGPLATVLLSATFQGTRFNMWTYFSMPVICGGLVICSMKEGNFDTLGVVFAAGSCILRSVKSIMQENLLAEKIDSVTLLYYMAPWSAAMLFAASLMFEGLEPLLLLVAVLDPAGVEGELHVRQGVPRVIVLLILSGMNACMLNVANFLVTSYTNAVTLQVLGNVKNLLGIVISARILGNELTSAQATGMCICLFGVWLYNYKGSKVSRVAAVPLPSVGAAEGNH